MHEETQTDDLIHTEFKMVDETDEVGRLRAEIDRLSRENWQLRRVEEHDWDAMRFVSQALATHHSDHVGTQLLCAYLKKRMDDADRKTKESGGVVDRLVEAAASVYQHILTQGHVGNHGHNREGTACGECQKVNALGDAIKPFTFPVPPKIEAEHGNPG